MSSGPERPPPPTPSPLPPPPPPPPPPPILAARRPSVSDDPAPGRGAQSASPKPERRESSGSGRPKRTLIESACSACRRRKSKCDGLRPACSRCTSLRSECIYEAEEGESRWSALRRRNQILETERAEVRELMSYVHSRPEDEAHEIFNRIRSGGYDDVFHLLRQVREGELPLLSSPVMPSFGRQSSNASSNAGESVRLPPIQRMFEVSGTGGPSVQQPQQQGGGPHEANLAVHPQRSNSLSFSSRRRGSPSPIEPPVSSGGG